MFVDELDGHIIHDKLDIKHRFFLACQPLHVLLHVEIRLLCLLDRSFFLIEILVVVFADGITHHKFFM